MKRTLFAIFSVGLLFLSGTVTVKATPVYEVVDLGIGMAFDINNVGQAVGDVGDGINGFIWDSVNGRQEKEFKLFGINDNGEAVGGEPMKKPL